jgi:acyl carrier protein
MDRSELIKVVREVAREVLAVDPDAITENADFRQDLDVDSLELMDFVGNLEKRLGLDLDEEDFVEVATIGDALDVLAAASPKTVAVGE